MIDTRFLSVFLSGIATAYFALSAYFLFRRKESSRLQIVVGCIFLQWTVLNLKDFIFTQYDASSQVLQDIVVLLDGTSLIGYTFLLYELIRPRWATWRKALGMLMVYILFFILYAVWPSQTVINCYLVCLTIAGTVIFFVWLRQALTYAKYIRDNFSNIDDTDISWLRIVALFFVICQLIWVAISIIRVPLADSLYYASSIILWQYTLERILHQKPVDMEPLVIEPAAGGGRFYAFEDTLPKMMEQEGLYLNPQLSIKDLATHVGTNRTYLSDYFVNVLQTTFYDYINSLRIEKKSIPLMQEHPDYTIERIATESGFNSISTFHRSFQKLKGMSPGTYKKKMNAIRHS